MEPENGPLEDLQLHQWFSGSIWVSSREDWPDGLKRVRRLDKTAFGLIYPPWNFPYGYVDDQASLA